MSREVSEVRKRVQQRLAELKRAAAVKRERLVEAERDFGPFLTDIATPVFNAVAHSLSAEGHPYRVTTPGGSLRLTSDRSARTYVELRLETSGPSPAVIVEVSRERGHRVEADERPLAAGIGIDALTHEHVVSMLVEAMGELIER